MGGRNLDDPAFPGAAHSLADELLKPSVIYAPAMLALLREVDVHAVAHITGGGIARQPLPCAVTAQGRRRARAALVGTAAHLRRDPAARRVSDDEMAKVFNLGLGMVVVVPASESFRAQDILRRHHHGAHEIGTITEGSGSVQLT